MENHGIDMERVRQWGHVQLPTGQVAQSLFSENRWMSENKHISRNVKVCHQQVGLIV